MTTDTQAAGFIFLIVLAAVLAGLWLYRKAKPAPAEKLAAELCAEAQRKEIEESCAAEMHQALATMYGARAKRYAPAAKDKPL
ncbi:MAG: hypothetical protein EOO54_03725 [Haliea sp.]|nr:MAG: hypothetical protein EOO54_03725 [Haliea sp.]